MTLIMYGVFGLRDSSSRRLFGGRESGLSCRDIEYCFDCYTRRPEGLHDGRFNTLSADLRGLPPAFIAAAALDPLLDDSVAMQALPEQAPRPRFCAGSNGSAVTCPLSERERPLTLPNPAIQKPVFWIEEILFTLP